MPLLLPLLHYWHYRYYRWNLLCFWKKMVVMGVGRPLQNKRLKGSNLWQQQTLPIFSVIFLTSNFLFTRMSYHICHCRWSIKHARPSFGDLVRSSNKIFIESCRLFFCQQKEDMEWLRDYVMWLRLRTMRWSVK